jgi:hypothetical protein
LEKKKKNWWKKVKKCKNYNKKSTKKGKKMEALGRHLGPKQQKQQNPPFFFVGFSYQTCHNPCQMHQT